ncbi:hypothetical protein MKX08_004178 [Trichoderma sp. CBMAI-0020]|nr:hypothetical protein MKX08_004178 [Trichoderma sp. CBMAI-0020]
MGNNKRQRQEQTTSEQINDLEVKVNLILSLVEKQDTKLDETIQATQKTAQIAQSDLAQKMDATQKTVQIAQNDLARKMDALTDQIKTERATFDQCIQSTREDLITIDLALGRLNTNDTDQTQIIAEARDAWYMYDTYDGIVVIFGFQETFDPSLVKEDDNDTPEDRLEVAYQLNGDFLVETYEFGKFLLPYLKDGSADTTDKLITMLKGYDAYWDIEENKLLVKHACQRRVAYTSLFWEATRFSDFLRDVHEVAVALSEDLAYFDRTGMERGADSS